MLSLWLFPPPDEPPLPASGEALPPGCGLCDPPPPGMPELGIGIPTVGSPAALTPPETVGPLWPPPL
jgi:hypothetical protein